MAAKYYNYLLPGLMALLMFASNFLNTNLFSADVQSFTVWFLISLFVFVCGWLILKNFNWIIGGKIIFTVSVGMVIISLILVVLFRDYFDVNNPMVENLILYSLRNIMLGSMGMFGLTVAEVIRIQHDQKYLEKSFETKKSEFATENEKMIELLVSEAKLKAEKIVFDAEKRAMELKEKSSQIESKLKELILLEKDLIKKYEEEEKNELDNKD